MALADYNDLIELTEQMLSGMVKELICGYKVTYHANGYDDDPIEIDFTPPHMQKSLLFRLLAHSFMLLLILLMRPSWLMKSNHGSHSLPKRSLKLMHWPRPCWSQKRASREQLADFVSFMCWHVAPIIRHMLLNMLINWGMPLKNNVFSWNYILLI